MPQAHAYERFTAQNEKLVSTAGNNAVAYLLLIQRQWHVPDPGPVGSLGPPDVPEPGRSTWDWDIFNLASFLPDGTINPNGIVSAFDRWFINNEYARIITTSGPAAGGRIADVMANKEQCDWVAGLERATTLRYMSPIRAAMHAAARRQGHGDPLAGVFAEHRNSLERTLQDGYPPEAV